VLSIAEESLDFKPKGTPRPHTEQQFLKHQKSETRKTKSRKEAESEEHEDN
jgi:hypothetical protein